MNRAGKTLAPTDAGLLAEFKRHRSEAAFAQLVARHGGLVLSVCRSVLRTDADAEDAAQAVFLALARKPPRHNCLAGWLHRVAWFVSARAAHARAVRRRHEQEAAAMASTLSRPHPDCLSPELLHEALARLPEKYRLPLILHHLEGRSQDETAALLNVSPGAVAMRLNRGRRMLRVRMSRAGRQVPEPAAARALAPLAPTAPSFVASASKAAILVAAGKAVPPAAVSTTSLSLAKGALNMLFWSKVKTAAILMGAVLLAGGTAGTYVTLAQSGTNGGTSSPSQQTQIAGGGSITEITGASVTITRNGTPTTVAITAGTVVKLDGKVVTPNDLKTGLYAIVFGWGTTAGEIRAYTPKSANSQPTSKPQQIAGGGSITEITGTSITITRSGTPATVTVTGSTVFKLDDKVVALGDLKTGLYAGAWGSGTTAGEIRAYTPKPADSQPAPKPQQIAGGGSITEITGTSITITRNGTPATVTVTGTTVFKLDGKVVAAGDLKTGLYAMAFGSGTTATEIRAYTPKPN